MISIHIKYHLNLKTIIFLGVIYLTLIFDLLYNTGIFRGASDQKYNYLEYYRAYIFDSSFFIFIIVLVIGSFLVILGENEYDVIYITFVGRKRFIFTKIIADIIFLILILFGVFSLFLFIPSIILFYFKIDLLILRLMVDFIIEGIIIMLFAQILSFFIKNYFASAIIIIFFWMEKIITDDYETNKISSFIKINQLLFPVLINDGKYFFLYGELYCILLILMLILGCIFLFDNKNL